MRHRKNIERITALWESFDLISAELAKAKRQLREGNTTPEEVDWLRAELHGIRGYLAELGEHAVDPEAAADREA